MTREGLRRGFEVAAFFCLLAVPLAAVGAELLEPDGLWILKLLDAGGQSAYSRALLRLSVALGLICLWLWRPPSVDGRRGDAYDQRCFWTACAAGLGCGLVSCLLSSHPYAALAEWETWLLGVLLGYTVSRRPGARLQVIAPMLLYCSAGAVSVHAFLLLLSTQQERLGGLFHHPNALSALLLASLPLFWWRALLDGRDRSSAYLGLGLAAGLLLRTQSLTGLLFLVLAGACWAFASPGLGLLFGGAAGVGLFILNLYVPGALLPTLVGLLGAVVLLKARAAPELRGQLTLIFFGGAGLLLLLEGLQPMFARGATARWLSGQVRWDLLTGGLELLRDHPLWGVGPAGFGRFYPAVQESLVSYSRFVHGTVWEIAVEWGLLALLCWTAALALFLKEVYRRRDEPFALACAAAAGLGGLHSLTDTQTQFPLLLLLGWMLVGAALCTRGDQAPENERHRGALASRESRLGATCRIALLGLLLGLLWLNGARASTALLQEAALRSPYLTDQERAALYRESVRLTPSDAEGWRGLGLLRYKLGDRQAAVSATREAVRLDPHRGACWYAFLRTLPASERSLYLNRALGVDPNNYPWFYAASIAGHLKSGEAAEALEVLRAAKVRYRPEVLAPLPTFRRSDLEDQLVLLFALEALLEDALERRGAARQALARAVVLAAGSPQRWESLVAAPNAFELPTPLWYEELLQEVQESFPREPSSAGSPEPIGAEFDEPDGL